MVAMDWQVVFYMDPDGEEPVKDFILTQSDGAIAEIIHVFKLLSLQHQPRNALRPENWQAWASRTQNQAQVRLLSHFLFRPCWTQIRPASWLSKEERQDARE